MSSLWEVCVRQRESEGCEQRVPQRCCIFTPTFLSSLFAQCSFVFFCAAACFKCMTCNVSLQLGAECGGPDGSLQCKKCYQQKFGPKGFGHGAAIAQGSQVQHDSPTHSVAAEPTAVECMLQKEAQQSASPSPSPSQAAPQAATTGSKFCSECGKAKDPSSKFCESFLIFNSTWLVRTFFWAFFPFTCSCSALLFPPPISITRPRMRCEVLLKRELRQ